MSTIEKDLQLLDSHIGVFNIRNLRHADWLLVLTVAGLAAVGLLAQYHATTSSDPNFQKQALFLAIGTVAAAFLVCIDYRFLVSLGPVGYAGLAVLLLAVPFAGVSAKGGQHWLPVGPFRLQPSEFSKLGLVYMLAWYVSSVKGRIRRFPFFILAFVFSGVVCGLIALQGDLGTMLVLLPVPFVMLYTAGAKCWHLLLVMLAGLSVSPLAWDHLKDYQRARLTSFINPDADPQGSGYQLVQAKIAIGSGGMTGKGFGENTQAHLEFMPEYHNDFVFALLGEGLGFLGGALVIALFTFLLLRALALARECTDTASTLLVVGCASILGFHAVVNIGITLGLLPVTGLPLPFLSYGGSFYLTTMLCIGTILSANVRRGMFE